MLTTEQRATYQMRLDRAEKAYENLMTGKAVRVLVDQNGERVEFVAANAGKLASYIIELKTILGTNARPLGPMRVYF